MGSIFDRSQLLMVTEAEMTPMELQGRRVGKQVSLLVVLGMIVVGVIPILMYAGVAREMPVAILTLGVVVEVSLLVAVWFRTKKVALLLDTVTTGRGPLGSAER